MSSSTQSRYSEAFKTEAIALAQRPGVKLAQVARDLGIHDATLRLWMREAGAKRGKASRDRQETEHEEVIRLRRELARVTVERDFLKKVSAFFAKETR